MARQPTNIAASVRARLLTIAQSKNQPLDLLLTRYTLERFLYRLSTSAYRERFVLKGAMLLTAWFDDPHRATRDIDLLGFGDAEREAIAAIFTEICMMPADDGVVFAKDALSIDELREDNAYGGLRLKTMASIGTARVRVVIDIGFGDAVEPGLDEIELPVLLDMPAPMLRSYARETVIAEKFQAMVALGRANSRMKDFYDIWLLSEAYEFAGDGLARALIATFARRTTPLPQDLPDAFTSAFAEDNAKVRQWNSFIDDVAHPPGTLAEVIEKLAQFLMPHVAQARILDR